MERVTDNFLQDARDCMSSNLQMMLDELYECRKAKKKGAGVLPIPCTAGGENWTLKLWFQKINEELDELKDEMLNYYRGLKSVIQVSDVDMSDPDDSKNACRIAEEAADVITAITSMLEAMGIDERERQDAQRRVNARNRERGRIMEC